jgi:chromosome partitioning protein
LIARKGGSGKTTIAVHLALAAYFGRRHVLIADADSQHSAVEALKPRNGEGPTVTETTGRELSALQRQAARGDVDLMVIDTAAGLEEGLSHAIVLADLSLLVVRPTFLDIASAVQSLQVIRKMQRSAMVVLSQAPPTREGVEPPAVKRTLEVFKAMHIPVLPTIVRARSIYQTAMEKGRAVQELLPSGPAAREIDDLWNGVEHILYDPRLAKTG